MSKKKYHGVVAAMVTPFTAEGEADAKAMERLCGTLFKHGCDGAFVLSSTGGLPLLDEGERRELVAAAARAAGAEQTVYAGVSGTGVRQAIRYAKNAAADGADVAVIMCPFFLKFDQAQVYEYILAVAEASPIPVAVYHHLRMASAFEVETVARLAEHENLVAMKDTSVDLDRMSQLVAATKGKSFSVFQGSEKLLLESLTCGAAGFVTALANIVPDWHKGLFDAVRAGDREKAEMYNARIVELLWLLLSPNTKSFAHFVYILHKGLMARGWVESIHGMVRGFSPEPEFDLEINAMLAKLNLIETRN